MQLGVAKKIIARRASLPAVGVDRGSWLQRGQGWEAERAMLM